THYVPSVSICTFYFFIQIIAHYSIYTLSLHDALPICETSRKLVDNMSDIVWVVNPKKDSLHDLILRLKDSYSEVLTYMGISLKTTNLHQLENIKLPMEYRQNLYLIFKKGINNAIKHSGCKNLYLNINLNKDNLEMKLIDNGTGMKELSKESGNGLKNMEERARIIGGKLDIDSDSSGTTITFTGKINSIKKVSYYLKRFLRSVNLIV